MAKRKPRLWKPPTRVALPEKTVLRLWLAAGGRCAYRGHNEPLWRDDVTLAEMNAAYVAHIVAAKKSGPRGDPVRSPKLARELSNLMLLCDKHHRMIDVERVAEHPEKLLLEMKHEHEDRIAAVTALHGDRKSEMLRYAADTSGALPSIKYTDAARAMLPERYPLANPGTLLGIVGSKFAEGDPEYWSLQEANLRRGFERGVLPRLVDGSIPHLSVFAFAPQPLLVLLGTLLTDKYPADVHQVRREPPGWGWFERAEAGDANPLHLNRPTSNDGPPALVLSLSASIDPERIRAVLGPSACIWEITAANPHNDMMRERSQLSSFRTLAREALSGIKTAHGEKAEIHVFPAAPISASVELGRVHMPKADLPLRIYDHDRKTGGFAFALHVK